MSSKSSTTDAGVPEHIVVGLIHKPHGIAGEVAVEPMTDLAARFAPGSRLEVVVPGVPRRTLEVRSARAHGRGLLVRFAGIDSRDRAEELRAGRLEVAVADVPPAPEGEYYHFELLGCRCFDAAGAGLGVVEEVLEDGGGVVLSVRDGDERLLIPFVRAYLRRVDLTARRIELDLPDGLVETCKSRS
jgi:16S rRNA processing protein RimM